MSDKDPLGAMIRELAPWPRLKYITEEWGHAWVNLFTEGYRNANIDNPQYWGKITAFALVSAWTIFTGWLIWEAF